MVSLHPVTASPPDEPDALGGRYELGDVLGRGGMADVYRATDRVLKRDVAVKVLRLTSADETDRRRFEAEARTLAGLSHPGLVTVLDVGADEERAYLVMELVTGGTLARSISAGPVDPDTVAAVGAQTAQALAYAHDRGVVHRDVKPANVLLDAKGRVKLADFGIARLIGDTVRHTRTGTAVGTAAYLSPEQVRGVEVTGAADVYALGLTLLEALTAERAYPGSPTEAALARLHSSPPVPGTLPPWWRDLLVAMTDLEPERRPTAAQVAERLTTAGEDPATRTAVLSQPVPVPVPVPVAATPPAPTAWDRIRGRLAATDAAQRAVAITLGALVLLILIAALAAGSGDDGTDTPDPVDSTTSPAESEPAVSPSTSGTPTTTTTPPETTPSPVPPPDEDDDADEDDEEGPGPGKGPKPKGGKGGKGPKKP